MSKSKKINVKKLLSQQSWTPKEIGQLLLSSMINDIEQQNQNQQREQLFSQERFDEIEGSIETAEDYLIYGVYQDIYFSIIDSYNRGLGLHQRFYNGFFRILADINELKNADKAQANFDNMPLIMTESQYKSVKEEVVKTIRGYQESYYDILFYVLDRFLEAVKAGEEVPESIRKAIEATKEEPATNKSFSSLYNEIVGNGYFSLPDGKRSDQMTIEQWKKALEEEFLKNHKLTIDGRLATAEETVQSFKQNRLIKSYELFFKGTEAIEEFVLERTGKYLEGTETEIKTALSEVVDSIKKYGYENKVNYSNNAKLIAESLGILSPVEWHIYKELPDGLTAYDILDILVIFASNARYDEKTEKKNNLKIFKSDYPELYKAINDYIEENVPKARGLKPNQLYKDIVCWGELADDKIIGYKLLIQPDDEKIVQIWRNEEKGKETVKNKIAQLATSSRSIAILKNPADYQVDENGNYTEKNPIHVFQNLYSLERNRSKVMEIKNCVEDFIYYAMRYFYAFNDLMKIMEKVYDLPGMAAVVRCDAEFFEKKMKSFNNVLYSFYYDVHGDELEKQRKRNIIKKVFVSLETDSLKPMPKNIRDVKAELIQLGFTNDTRKKVKYLDFLLDHLMNN